MFEILASDSAGEVSAPISADAASCEACVAEIFDPHERRFRYAFTNCTNCGPRFTITTAIPYDRANTTMRDFPMCADCRAEYEDPADRRFHAEPIACPRCGPSLRLVDGGGVDMPGDPIARVAALLREGKIVAVKGLGGYHLACDAGNEAAVAEMRRRKAREQKPLAMMAPDLGRIRELAHVTKEAEKILVSPRAPIVLLPKRESGTELSKGVAPGNRYIGVMLPYTPLHHLLLGELGSPIVLTSGNISEEPMAYLDLEAQVRLRDIADAFLMHDRPIRMRCDDSVVRVERKHSYPIRRARGYAPSPLEMVERFQRPVLAAGPELKHTFCIGVAERAIISHHVGDLENFETMEAFVDAVEHLTRVFSVEPQVVAYDLHPEYLENIFARQVIAYGKAPDVAVAFSTSGGSRNVLLAVEEARRRGLLTVCFAGYGGGRLAELCDCALTVDADYIPRIQEAQATQYHVLRRLLSIESTEPAATIVGMGQSESSPQPPA